MGGAQLARTFSRCWRGRPSEEGLEACLQADLPDGLRTCREMNLLSFGFVCPKIIPS